MSKRCRRCQKVKPLEDFARFSKDRTGRQAYCKSCNAEYGAEWRARPENRVKINAVYRKWRIKEDWGLTVAEYEALLAGPCAICGEHSDHMNLDHDHRNGKVRAALCARCNLGLGYFGDQPEALRTAARYIERWQKEHMET